MQSETPITDANICRDRDGYSWVKPSIARRLELSHATLLTALKSLSNNGQGSFKDWENGEGINIQEELETVIKTAEKLHASSKQ